MDRLRALCVTAELVRRLLGLLRWYHRSISLESGIAVVSPNAPRVVEGVAGCLVVDEDGCGGAVIGLR
jgi:hypothetical protein